MKKSIYTFLAVLFLLFLHPQLGHAESSFPIFLNGNALASGKNINGTTMVPIRIISEKLGANVDWDDKEKKVSVTKNNLNIEMQINKKDVKVNGQFRQLVEAPLNAKGSALLPLRFLAEQLGVKVTWNDSERAVYMVTPVIANPVIVNPVITGETQPLVIPVISPLDAISQDLTESDVGGLPVPEPSTEIQYISSDYDQVTIRANGDLHPSMFYLSSPDRLVVDFTQSTLAPDLRASSGFSVTSSVYLDKVRYANYLDKPVTVRVVVDLKQKNIYELVEDKENHVVIIMQKPPSVYTVVIDAGHGGKDTGAISVNKRLEKDFNLAMVLKIQQLLAQEPLIQVVLTRNDDTFVELDDRAALANNLGASLFVSIHGNSYAKTSNGTETYYYRDESLSFAQTMHPYVLGATGFSDKKVKKEKFRVVAATMMPAILCEIGYLSNPIEEAEMYKDEFQNRVAASIVAGIKDYLHIN
ncbi:MAG: N-acetylmuramoyl-L-alanine amidase family protein [Paenibacillaceae bacterium]